MGIYVKKYEKIVDELIKKSFPKLKDKKIFLFNFMLSKSFVAYILDLTFLRFIFVNPKKMERYSQSDQKVIFVHELCHFERLIEMSFFSKVIFKCVQFSNPAFFM